MSSDLNNSHDSSLPEVPASVLREKPEPAEATASVPLWMFPVFGILIAWGAFYLAMNSGGFLVSVYDTNKVSWDGAGGGAAAAAPDPMVIGKRVFTQNCAVCHQANGEGVAGQFPPLAGSEWVMSQDWHGDNHLVKIVLHGLQGMVTVKGAQFNNAMTPWGKVLKDDQIAAVLTYVRNEWGNQAPPITKEFVAKVREASQDRAEPWTQKELQAIGRELVNEAEAAPAAESSAPAESPAPAEAQPGA